MAYADKIIFNDIKYDKVYKGSELVVETEREPAKTLSFTALENSVISFVKAIDDPNVFPINLQYKYEYDSNFTDWGTDSIRLNKGEKIYVRGDNPNGLSYYDEDTELWKYSHFIINLGKVEANGNIMSIIDGGACTRMDVPEYCFYSLFKDCTALVTSPALQAETLSNYCYGEMFSGCTSLQTIESLDMSNVGVTISMFSDCTSLSYIRLKGKLNVGLIINQTTLLDYDSVKSILTAASKTTDTKTKNLNFNSTQTDQNGELASLISTCTSKGWTVSGLTLN